MSDILFRNLAEYNKETKSFPSTKLTTPHADGGDDSDDDENVVPVFAAKKKCEHRYAHFFLEKILIGKSVGLVYKEEHFRTMKLLGLVDEQFQSEAFLDLFDKDHSLRKRVNSVLSI